jgi:hypothetical protein
MNHAELLEKFRSSMLTLALESMHYKNTNSGKRFLERAIHNSMELLIALETERGKDAAQ